jgi:hypothetical protein
MEKWYVDTKILIEWHKLIFTFRGSIKRRHVAVSKSISYILLLDFTSGD